MKKAYTFAALVATIVLSLSLPVFAGQVDLVADAQRWIKGVEQARSDDALTKLKHVSFASQSWYSANTTFLAQNGCINTAVTLYLSKNTWADTNSTFTNWAANIYRYSYDSCRWVSLGSSSGYLNLDASNILLDSSPDFGSGSYNGPITMFGSDGSVTLMPLSFALSFTGTEVPTEHDTGNFKHTQGGFINKTRYANQFRSGYATGSLTLGSDSYVTPVGGNSAGLGTGQFDGKTITY